MNTVFYVPLSQFMLWTWCR